MRVLSMIRLITLGSLLGLVLVGCSSTSNSAFQPALNIELNIEATGDINVFEDGEARPVILRIYQLNDVGNFDKASFTRLYSDDQSALAGSLIDTKQLSAVLPGEKRTLVLDVQQQAKFLAVFAEFSNYETATSKSSVALVEEPESYPVFIAITHDKVEITQPVKEAWWKF
ncbi:type VI secretion system lipoprotein TssJ [Marinomonas mediterranea]|jgi:type VI secretion lipoprotein, VC_A0113 family|nr:type VI secretion system lipoprotein TssJ [Marinomonas mediterranea]WCN08130.1 type VI secretion system lipoprotein TssJ [Marinomonas mediterranea]WCN16271.1 type VI secretion system lipoprotein TssJ [Marinomonas mediterranea MMB-1]